jgi:urease accessory protein
MSLPRATRLGPAGPADDSVTLDYEGRFLRRRRLETDGGRALLVDLPQATGLQHGDVLECADGWRVAIHAAPEPLIAVTGDLSRLAWHIGNRHTPCQIETARLLIRDDHVLADMLDHLGAGLERLSAPFRPEGGAYGHGRTFGHAHGPADHAHSHDPAP